MMDIIELDHIILSFTADTHSYSQKDISAEAQKNRMALKPALKLPLDYSAHLLSISLSRRAPTSSASDGHIVDLTL
jgi:hypothetical protein